MYAQYSADWVLKREFCAGTGGNIVFNFAKFFLYTKSRFCAYAHYYDEIYLNVYIRGPCK